MPLKATDIKIEVNSKYSFTDRKEHEFYKSLLENFTWVKVDEEKGKIIGSTYIS